MLSKAKKTYHDNFLEYRLTGEQKYKQASDGALQNMNGILSDLEARINSSPTIPQDFAHTLRDGLLKRRLGRTKLIEEKDELKGAEMRLGGQPSLTSIDWRYYAIAVLGLVTMVMMG